MIATEFSGTRFTALTLVLAACGGAASSEASPAGPALPAGTAPAEPALTESGGMPVPSAEPPSLPAAPSPCEGNTSTGRLEIAVRNQRELDALEGCSTIVGDLAIEAFPVVDLRPLGSLRTVQGTLTLGSLYGIVRSRTSAISRA
jgi:hypothetical protein